MIENEYTGKKPEKDDAGTLDFVHLHLHTEYSLLDGAIRLRDLPVRLKELGMQSCAITDHGVLFGAVDFYTELIKNNIKPIIGCEVYVAPRKYTDKEAGTDNEPAHMVLLAENDTGYRNLIKLVSAGFTEGFYYRPRIDHDLLSKHHEGIIALSACLSGAIPRAILNRQQETAYELARFYSDLFGQDNFYLELQSNGIADQNLVNSTLIKMSNETGIPLVATNDCHYLKKEDATAHEVLLCMQTGKRMSDPDRMRMESDAFYLKSKEEMIAAFEHVPEAIANTVRIAERCNFTYSFDQLHLPSFDVPEDKDHKEYLYELCRDGLSERLELAGSGIPMQEYERRLDYELDVINTMGYTDYYLIVWDFIRFARERKIMVGPGRGSGAGSLAAWCLHITDIDPLKYQLIFERFLNAERVSMPDFDIDFCYERRPEVMEYVVEKYGKDRVAQVITFGTLAARACIRDVGRALDVSYTETDRIARMIPTSLGITLKKALEINPDMRADYEENETTRQVIDLAMKFEGMPRHASTHAAGVVISSQPLTDLAPLARNEDAIVVQFAKNNIEKVGLLKFDFLGLRTLTVMRETADLVRLRGGPEIDFDTIDMNDSNVFSMISDGLTDGVFQLESPGMTSFMKELRPESLEDVIAGISLYRPGPMEQIPRYVAARHDPSKIRYDHPLLEPILNVTYGCIVYQEQVMQIVRDLAGFSMGQSDNVRRAMSKKKPAELSRYRKLFIHGGEDEKGRTVPGAIARGVSLATAEKIFDDVMAFAGYAFNKSHAAAYAVVAYYTGWLKYYFPVEFMAAMLNSYLGNLAQAANYVSACRKMRIQVLPPDINRSFARFTPENGAIRFSLAAVKNVGAGAIGKVIEIREREGIFTSFGDFLRRLSETDLNRKMVESLIRSSALDCFNIPRVKMIASAEPFLNQLAAAKKRSMEGQLSLFELANPDEMPAPAEPVYPDLKEFSHMELLAMEKEMLGLYVTGHPLDDYSVAADKLTTIDSSEFAAVSSAKDDMINNPSEHMTHNLNLGQESKVVMAGIILSRRNKLTKNNDTMSFVQMEDLAGSYEMIVFPSVYRNYAALLEEGNIIVIAGRLSLREDEAPKLIAEQIAPLTVDMRKHPDNFHYANTNGYNNARTRSQTHASRKSSEDADYSRKDRNQMQTNNNGFSKQETDENYPSSDSSDDVEHHNNRPIVIKYNGQEKDEGYNSLLAALQYFHGSYPVKIYLSKEARIIDLPADYWVSTENEVLNELAARYGIKNISLL